MKIFTRKTKKLIAVISLCLIVMSLASCATLIDEVVASLGKYEKRVFFTYGVFQDFTDYAKYYYTSANTTENAYFQKIQKADMEIINTHLDDYERWIEVIKENEPSSEVAVNYDFDREIIDLEDYYFIDSKETTWSDGHTALTSYNIFLFDSQTQVLYYFHNNI